MFSQAAPVIHTLTYAAITADQGVWFGVFLITLIFITPLVYLIATAWEGVIKLRLEAGLKQQVIALKQQMIERGMTADEIVQVLGPPSEARDGLPKDEEDECRRSGQPKKGPVPAEV